MKQTSKNYKYFNRGQYQVEADAEDLAALKNHRKVKLQNYEQSLKRFEYKAALNKALLSGNPEVVIALIEELVERGALYTAIGSRSEEELQQLLKFLIWKVGDYRYAAVLLEVTRIAIDMYSAVLNQSQTVQA
jgi:U3 small nucleolar RNA-associated protein 15